MSAIVNQYVRRDGGKLVCSDDGPWFSELRERVETKWKKEKSEGTLEHCSSSGSRHVKSFGEVTLQSHLA